MDQTETYQPLKCSLDVPEDEIISGIRIYHSPREPYIQNITFETNGGSELEFKGSKKNRSGSWYSEDIFEGERIVGLYGYLKDEPEGELAALGFVVWTPDDLRRRRDRV